jgi:hypothetical protein
MVNAERPMLKLKAIETAPNGFVMIPVGFLRNPLCEETSLSPRSRASKRTAARAALRNAYDLLARIIDCS